MSWMAALMGSSGGAAAGGAAGGGGGGAMGAFFGAGGGGGGGPSGGNLPEGWQKGWGKADKAAKSTDDMMKSMDKGHKKIKDTADGTKKMFEAMKKINISSAFVAMFNAVGEAMSPIREVFGAVKDAFVGGIMQGAAGGMKKFINSMSNFIPVVQEVGKAVGQVVNFFLDAGAEIMKGLYDLGRHTWQGVQDLWGHVTSWFDELPHNVSNWWNNLTTNISAGWNAFWSGSLWQTGTRQVSHTGPALLHTDETIMRAGEGEVMNNLDLWMKLDSINDNLIKLAHQGVFKRH
jgi:hypothetical protein